MTPEELDRILSRADEIVPSSGFVAQVVDAVQQESATPPPIRFPWRRALPGFGAAVLLAIVTALVSAEPGDPTDAVTWAAAALVATVAPLAIVRRVLR
jgi:hypothetical protein